MTDRLSQSQLILLAADRLREKNGTSFSASDLVVEAWKNCQDAFGLEGHSKDYPDSNRVLAHLMGDRGLVKRGLLSRVGSKRYALTTDGKAVVDVLARRMPEPTPKVNIGRSIDGFLQHAFESDAYEKWRCLRKQEIMVFEADDLWGANPAEFKRLLDEAAAGLAGGVAVLGSGMEVSDADVRNLSHLHSWLFDKYGRRYA